jgi:hypothetical protein
MADGTRPTLQQRVTNRLSINYSLLGTARGLVLHPLFIDTHDYRNTVFLAGSGRSGTTWAQEIINYRNDYRVISEPFTPHQVPLVRHFRYGQYVRPDDRNPLYLEPAAAILSGRVRGYAVDKWNRKRIARKRLVKEIHVHGMLKWIKTQFPEIPMIMLMRHPFAVANSNLELRFETHLQQLLAQDDLMEDHLEPFRGVLEQAEDPFERYVLMWCADNYVPLRQFVPGEIEIIFYENLCVAPESEMRRIFNYLGQDYDPNVLKSMSKPSRMARKKSAVVTGESLTDSWRKNLSGDQIRRGMEILRLFGLDQIYGEGAMPRISESSEILGLIPADQEAPVLLQAP